MIHVYQILQVSATASDEEIAKSYKKLSRMYHPDHGGDPDKMAQLNEAYNLVNTPEKRKKYDSENAFSTTFRQWETIFGKCDIAKNFGNAPSDNGKAVRGTDITVKVNIPLTSFISGERFMSVKYDKQLECLECSGSGVLSKHKCPVCGGVGKVRSIVPEQMRDSIRKCESCDGTGEVVKEKCEACGGEGFTGKTCTHTFSYKPHELEMTVVGKGNEGMFGGENGNLILKFNPIDETDTEIKFCGDHFERTVGIYPEDFLLGITIDFDFGGKLVVYHMDPVMDYKYTAEIPNVAGVCLPLMINFVLKPEENGAIEAIHDELVALRDARNPKKD